MKITEKEIEEERERVLNEGLINFLRNDKPIINIGKERTKYYLKRIAKRKRKEALK